MTCCTRSVLGKAVLAQDYVNHSSVALELKLGYVQAAQSRGKPISHPSAKSPVDIP